MSTASTYYTSIDDVLNFLSLSSGDVDANALIKAIQMAEAQIEAESYTCFAGKPCVSTLEYHSLTTWLGGIWMGAGIPIHLGHKPVRRILRFELFNGSNWLNMLNYPEGRVSGWWWCKYEDAVCYIQTLWWYQGGNEVRIQYEYGYNELPGYVRELATLLSARNYILMERNRLSMLESTQSISFDRVVEAIDAVVPSLMARIRGVGIATGLVG
ncbi:MAG: hypothetical protein QW320_06765 [Ignisphaera sp.]|uniref:hypothetical protein n=1 Tax=Thermofilum sp. TaxID=1961369 RepID=UPI0031697D96